jgi:hypothetical protein
MVSLYNKIIARISLKVYSKALNFCLSASSNPACFLLSFIMSSSLSLSLLSLFLPLSLSHTHTHTLSLSLYILSSYLSFSLSLSHTHTYKHTHSLSLSLSLYLLSPYHSISLSPVTLSLYLLSLSLSLSLPPLTLSLSTSSPLSPLPLSLYVSTTPTFSLSSFTPHFLLHFSPCLLSLSHFLPLSVFLCICLYCLKAYNHIISLSLSSFSSSFSLCHLITPSLFLPLSVSVSFFCSLRLSSPCQSLHLSFNSIPNIKNREIK